ncbi:hypothetical protein H0I31_02130 [Tenacibaculum sp. AHE15PA]|uniref:hypothetical protein n=1 Tax=unclassified Tenacibaculum TaxID=2635139 RepID=UPI001C4FFA91|nr:MULTISPECIES: hypothetical protein [unclassified Tenacibaculum]QXP72520.1 hypothetical protein H0I30_07385 [Tenacibaculum sp. AHE14PA]QXP76435.1 hypothetical protein H0I31_02130 [Tenacibaculum sp. AHE15PA]
MTRLKCNLASIIFLLFTSIIWSQDLTCTDFKTGKFFIPINKELKKYSIKSGDSIAENSFKLKPEIKNIIIIRDKDTQTEFPNGINGGNPQYELIKWINDCSYRLTYDSSKMDLNTNMKWINKNNGILVSKIKIEDKCMSYKATITTTEGKEISQKGIICKE